MGYGGSFRCLSFGSSLLPYLTKVSYLICYLDWRHWPWWYTINLWIAVGGMFLACFVRRRKARRPLYVAVLAAITVVTSVYSKWAHDLFFRARGLFRTFYHSVLCPYFYDPIANFFSDGTVSGRLSVAPATALALLALILSRRQQNLSQRKKELKV